jgi:hypothetical protein
MAFMSRKKSRPSFPSIADQRASSAARVSARGGNMSRSTRPSFPSIAEQRANNIVSGQKNARGYNSGFMRNIDYPSFPSIAEQRASSAARVSARGGNMSRSTRLAFPSIAAQRASSAARVSARGGNTTATTTPASRLRGTLAGAPTALPGGTTTPVSIRPRGAMHGPPRPAGSTLGAMHGPPRPIPPRYMPNVNPKGKLLSNKGLMIGAGAAVIAGLAMNRRGDGTSSGRAGMTKY